MFSLSPMTSGCRPATAAAVAPPPENFSGGIFPANSKMVPLTGSIRSPPSLSFTRLYATGPHRRCLPIPATITPPPPYTTLITFTHVTTSTSSLSPPTPSSSSS
ncbi:hypothetical protein Tco_1525943 [Tanacetum coccineum]